MEQQPSGARLRAPSLEEEGENEARLRNAGHEDHVATSNQVINGQEADDMTGGEEDRNRCRNFWSRCGLVSEYASASELLPHLNEGDLIEFRRTVDVNGTIFPAYSHWAIYIGIIGGAARVIHASTEDGDFGEIPTRVGDSLPAAHDKIRNGSSAEIRSDSLHGVTSRDLCRVNNGFDRRCAPLAAVVAIERAQSKLGVRNYNVLNNNCEHFVKWCRYGDHISDQANVVTTAGIALSALVLTRNPVAAVVVTAATAAYYHIGKPTLRRWMCNTGRAMSRLWRQFRFSRSRQSTSPLQVVPYSQRN